MQPSRFLITGGSQGIGAAIVEQARKAGHQVVFTGRNEELIEAMARKTGPSACRPTSRYLTRTREPSTRAMSAWVASTSS